MYGDQICVFVIFVYGKMTRTDNGELGPGENSLNIPGTKSGKNTFNDGSKLSTKSRALFERKEIDRSDQILPNCLAVKFTYFNKI